MVQLYFGTVSMRLQRLYGIRICVDITYELRAYCFFLLFFYLPPKTPFMRRGACTALYLVIAGRTTRQVYIYFQDFFSSFAKHFFPRSIYLTQYASTVVVDGERFVPVHHITYLYPGFETLKYTILYACSQKHDLEMLEICAKKCNTFYMFLK